MIALSINIVLFLFNTYILCSVKEPWWLRLAGAVLAVWCLRDALQIIVEMTA